VISARQEDGLAWEVRARIFADRHEALPVPRPGVAVRGWLAVFAAHERAALAAALGPTRERIEAALAADPVVPESEVGPLARALWEAPPPRCRLE
jgi:hypothetical protein